MSIQMYNTAMEAQTKRYETEALTKQESNRLRKMVLGYGNFQKVSELADMPNRTLREVLNRGYGKPETIKKLRDTVLDNKSN